LLTGGEISNGSILARLPLTLSAEFLPQVSVTEAVCDNM
jgi:hypothetical protein